MRLLAQKQKGNLIFFLEIHSPILVYIIYIIRSNATGVDPSQIRLDHPIN